MFGFETIEDALRFRKKESDGIFELMTEGNVHRGDMTVYTLAPTMAEIDARLHIYWEGKQIDMPGHQSIWENVLALPVMVGKRVA